MDLDLLQKKESTRLMKHLLRKNHSRMIFDIMALDSDDPEEVA